MFLILVCFVLEVGADSTIGEGIFMLAVTAEELSILRRHVRSQEDVPSLLSGASSLVN